MPKKTKNFRLSNDHIAFLTKYRLDHKLANTTEALEKILTDQQEAKPFSSKSSGASDLLPCKQRVTIQNELSCMNPPTLYKKVKITEITAEICRACQVLSKNLPEKYAVIGRGPEPIRETPETETFDRARQPITDPNRTDMPSDMTYCLEGLWVVKTKCQACRTRTFQVWYDCRKQAYAKKGAEQCQTAK